MATTAALTFPKAYQPRQGQYHPATAPEDDLTTHVAGIDVGPLTVPPPAPAPLPSGAARTSCPWHDTARWPLTARRELAPAGRLRHTACRGPGGSGPGAGACPTPRPG